MVWMALTFVTFTAFAGLALEFNRWQMLATRAAEGRRRGRARRVPCSCRRTRATRRSTHGAAIASLNGFTDGSNGVTIQTQVGNAPRISSR